MPGIIVCGVGTISTELVPYLSGMNYSVTVVTRNPQNAYDKLGTDITAISWDELQTNPEPYFRDCNAVINLARPKIASLAHPTLGMNPDQLQQEREAFKSGGVKTTAIIARLCARHGTPDKTVFLNASAYDHFDTQNLNSPPCSDSAPLDLSNKPQCFFTEVIRAWEEAAKPAEDAGIRVVHLGFGMITDQNSTGFSNILSLFQLGLGGRLGSGEQEIPMVTMRDALAAMMYCIKNKELSGYVNIVGFNVKQKDLAEELSEQIDRQPFASQSWMYNILRTIIPTRWLNNITKPETLIKFGAGIFSELLLKNVSVVSEKLSNKGFKFKDTDIASAVEYALEKPIGKLAYVTMSGSSYNGMALLLDGGTNRQAQNEPQYTDLVNPGAEAYLLNKGKNTGDKIPRQEIGENMSFNS